MQKIEVFEVDSNGEIIENYLWDAYQINDAIVENKNIIQQGWQERLFVPVWDFEKETWVEGLTQEEIEQVENMPKPPTEKERIEALEETLLLLLMEE